jgi:predicted transcriptional regulator of viral defense system
VNTSKRKAYSKTSDNKWRRFKKLLKGRTSVSIGELRPLIETTLHVQADYAIWKLLREGILAPIEEGKKGLYVVVDSGSKRGFLRDPLEGIRALYGNNVLFCYGTALLIHGLSRYGMVTEYYIAKSQFRRKYEMGQIIVRPVETRLSEHGVELIRSLRVTNVERTIMECIQRPKYANGWENVLHAMERIERLHFETVLEYLKVMRLPSMFGRMGVVLEHFARQWRIKKEKLEALQQYCPNRPIEFIRGRKGLLNKQWNMYVPPNLFEL